MTLLEFRTRHTEWADRGVMAIELGRSGNDQLGVGQGPSYLPPAPKHVLGALRLSHISGEDGLSWMLQVGPRWPILCRVERIQRIVDAADSAMPAMMQQRNPAEIRYCHHARDPFPVEPVGNLGGQIDVGPD